MLKKKGFYEFKNFRLDIEEGVLSRNGDKLALTPKAFHLLRFLIENRGHLIEKDELMAEIWADSFVEQGNLTFNIRQLRKTLGDDAREPTFIETVPRRGYRFIAEVKKVFAMPETELQKTETDFDLSEKTSPKDQKNKTPYVLAAVVLVGLILFGGWYLQNNGEANESPILNAPFTSEKISTNGKVSLAVISPDGENIIYVNGYSGDKQSVWIRQIESGSNMEIIPPTETLYGGLAISPDGNSLYFARSSKETKKQLDIFRVSIFGGVPAKIVGETQGWISISPDGKKISYVRCYRRNDDFCSLYIADSQNGQNEKKLVSRPRPFRIGDNEISPNGKSVAFAVGQSENQANDFSLKEVDITSGQERELTKEKFFNIKNIAWLPDRSGLLITAAKIPNKYFRIRKVSIATGNAETLTKDSETYSVLSLDKTANRLVSTQIKQDFKLSLSGIENPSNKRVLADAGSASFTPDGKIVFSSPMSGNDEIWAINADGSEQRQLTNNKADDSQPIVSPDNNWIFFASNRTGKVHIWRMNSDGSNQIQITKIEGGFPLFVTPDGKWVYYHHGLNRTLWRVSTESGKENSVINKAKSRYAVSPDGLQAAFPEIHGEEKFLAIISLIDGKLIRTLKYAEPQAEMSDVAWMPEGKNLAYILSDAKLKNNVLWIHPANGGMPRRITDLGNEEISETSGFAISPDGKSFILINGGWKHDAILLRGLK